MVAFDAPNEPYAHMGVQAPDESIWDARGQHHDIAGFISPFGTKVPKDGLRIVSFEQLVTDHPKYETWRDVGTERYASMMLPQLPHLPTSDRSRNIAFMDEVEALSRKYDLWIQARSGVHNWPVISEAFGEEVGYRVARHEGNTTFDRMLRSDTVRGPSHTPHTIEQFITKLAVLSEQHGLWIRSGLPTTWPRLVKIYGDDPKGAHYIIRQTDSAAGFLTTLS